MYMGNFLFGQICFGFINSYFVLAVNAFPLFNTYGEHLQQHFGKNVRQERFLTLLRSLQLVVAHAVKHTNVVTICCYNL